MGDNGPMASTPFPARSQGALSSDGEWWWSGERWLPAYTPDRKQRWNGVLWVRAGQRQEVILPPRLARWGIAWLVSLDLWLVAAVRIGHHSDAWKVLDVWLLGVGASVGLIATLVWGAALGRQRLWLALGLSAFVGTVWTLMVWGMVWLLLTPDTDPIADNEAGASVAILVVPVFLGVATALGIGGAMGRWLLRWPRGPLKS